MDEKEAKRAAFRINDDVTILHRPASVEDLESPIDAHFYCPSKETLLVGLQSLNKQSYEAISTLSRNNSQIANYLTVLDNKLNLLAEEVLYPKDALTPNKQIANLSEVGIAFGTNEQYPVGKKYLIKFRIEPSFQLISAIAEVKRSNSSTEEEVFDPDFEFWSAFSFTDISNIEQQWLFKHLLALQARELKNKRESIS